MIIAVMLSPQPLPLLPLLQRPRLRDIQRRHSIHKLPLQPPRLNPPLIRKLPTLIPKTGHDLRKIIIELTPRVEVANDFFVLDISGFKALEGLFALFGGGVAFAGGGEGGVCGAEAGEELRLGFGFGGEEGFVGVVAREAVLEEVFELGGGDFLRGEFALETGGFGEDYVVWLGC